uniref:Uncharacterized protein n=1 Tax=Branchiostoma floridae TaxID=7739 RepID=C3ZGE4_BRAFL|eukprot:XP_002592377.1 hypothetical protein BRAFLDRAFT_67238 [Branchiostoma floridae]
MSSPVTNLLDSPVNARYVRFVVQSWHGRISMRVEVLGCNIAAVAPVCPHLLGMESGAIPDDSISASSFYREASYTYGLEPRHGRLNAQPTKAWTAKYNFVGQWLQVFPGNVDMSLPVTNLLDNPVDARYVRFVVLSWNDRIAMRVEIVGCNTTIPDDSITASSVFLNNGRTAGLEPYRGRLNAGGAYHPLAWSPSHNVIGEWLQVFPGNVDVSLPVTNLLNNPVVARYVRFVVQSWHNRIAMRVEIVGCNTTAVPLPACPQPLGMESGAIPDGSITAPSFLLNTRGQSAGLDPYKGRLNGGAAWTSHHNYIGQWLQVDLGEMKLVMGTIIQGRLNHEHQWVTSYKLQYSTDRITWTYADSDGPDMVFPGNSYMSLPVTNLLNTPVDARYVRFVVQSWHTRIAMRVEIVGCNTSNSDMSLPVTNLLNTPVDARYVRFVVLSWHNHISMRAEIVGCNTTAVAPVCPQSLGMESGAIPDGSIIASSSFLNTLGQSAGLDPYQGRLNGGASWAANYDFIGQWLQVFPGNVDVSLPVTNLLNNSVDARYVRFVVQSWHNRIAMRVEIAGCNTKTCLLTKHVEGGTLTWDLPKFVSSPFIFEVKVNTSGSGSGLIYLYRWGDNTTDNQDGYRVELRSGQSQIVRTTRDADRENVASYRSTDMTSGEGFRRFWICWSKGGSLGVGRAGEVEPFMSWTDPHPITDISKIGYGISGEPGEFMFNCSQDKDECSTQNGGCSQTCTNNVGNYTCSCSEGFILDGDGHTCTDVDECSTKNGGCSQFCTNTVGSYNCSCSEGFVMGWDGHSCIELSTTTSTTTQQLTSPTTSPAQPNNWILTRQQTSTARLMDTSTMSTTDVMPTSSTTTVKTTTPFVFGGMDGDSSDYMDDEASIMSPMTTLPTLPPSTAEPTPPPPVFTTTQESSTRAHFLIEVMSETRDLLELLDAAADKLLEETPPEVESTYIRSDGVLTAVKKSIPDVGTVPISDDVGSIVFTKEDSFPKDSTMKVVAFVEDPFVWSVEKTKVTSSVVMVTITKEKDLPDASSGQPNITVVVKQRVKFGTTSDTEEQYDDTLPTSYRQNLDDAGRSFPLTKAPSRDANMKHHAMYIADGGQVPLLRFSVDDVDTELQVYFRFHDFPTEEEYDYTTTVKPPEVTDYGGFDMPFGLVYSNFSTSFVPEISMERGWLMVGVKKKGGDQSHGGFRRLLTSAVLRTPPPADHDVIPAGFTLQTAAVSCLMRENENQTWDNRRCQSHIALQTAVADSIALGQAAKLAKANSNMAIVPKVSTIPSDVPGADYVYVVSVRTGTQPDAGTASVVGLMITGSEGRTAMVTLNPAGLILARGGDTYHIMTTPASIGELQSVQVWHDSSGKGAMESLFIDNVKVWDVQTSQGFSFPCYSWLSSRKGDGRTIRTLQAADGEKRMSEYTLPTFLYLLYDDHLLLSAVCNSGVRHFSRAQRLVCCLAQTTLWMVGSAMWYGVKLGAHDVILFDAGVITLRLSELIGTAATSFTVFLPVYVILVPMFRKQPALEDQIPPGVMKKPTSQTTRRFPYTTVAWILAILTSVCSSFFVIVYSLQFGAERSQAWLKNSSWHSYSLRFCWSLFRLAYIQTGGAAVPARRVLPPVPRKTDHDPNWTERMTTGRNILVLLVFLLIFTGNAFYIGILGFDRHAYHIRTSLENSLLSEYEEVATVDDAWEWLSSELIPSLHPERGYSGQKLSWLDKQFPAGTNAFRIGPVRLERITKHPEDPIDIELETSKQKLYPELMMNLLNGALGRQNGKNCSNSDAVFIVNEVRNGSSSCLTTVDLPRAAGQAAAVIDFLKQTDWILMVSDTLILRANFYHPDVKLFSSVVFRLQYLPGGAAELQPSIQTFRLFQYQTADDYVQMLFHILFVLFYIYNILNEIWNIRKSGRAYFTSFWNVLILCNIGLSTATIVTFALRYIQAAAALRDIQQAKGVFGINEFVDISTAGQWDATFKEVLSFSIFISTFCILRVLNFSRGVATVYALPRLIYDEAFGFAVYMLVIIVAYGISGNLIFGKNMETFSGFKKTSYVLFEMGLGRPFVGVFADDMKAVDRVMGPLYYSTFVMVFVFYLMNLGVGMLCNWLSYCQTSDDIGVDTAMGDYFWNSFRSLLGMRHEPQDFDDEAPLPDHFIEETLQRTDTLLQEVDRLTEVMYKFECKKRKLIQVQPSTSQA